MAYKLMSNVNKVASFSRLRNEDMPSNILKRKRREIPHPFHGKVEKLFVLPRDAEPEPEPEPPEPRHFGRSRSRSRRNGLLGAGAGAGAGAGKKRGGSGFESGYNYGKITEC